MAAELYSTSSSGGLEVGWNACCQPSASKRGICSLKPYRQNLRVDSAESQGIHAASLVTRALPFMHQFTSHSYRSRHPVQLYLSPSTCGLPSSRRSAVVKDTFSTQKGTSQLVNLVMLVISSELSRHKPWAAWCSNGSEPGASA